MNHNTRCIRIAVIVLIAAILFAVPALAMTASEIQAEMAANSAEWHIANAAGNSARCLALQARNQELAAMLAAGGSAAFDAVSGTWSITTGDGSTVNSSSTQDGKNTVVSYDTTSTDGTRTQTSANSYSQPVIDSYINHGGNAYDVWSLYNTDANKVADSGAYGSLDARASAESEAAVAQMALGLSDEETALLEQQLTNGKRNFEYWQHIRDEALRYGDKTTAEWAQTEMDEIHTETETLRESYGYYSDTETQGDGGQLYVTSYRITAGASYGGSITPNSYTVTTGQSATFSITPNSGYAIAYLTVDGKTVTAANSYTFSNVTNDHAISAYFYSTAQQAPAGGNTVPTTYTIEAKAGVNGTITPSGSSTVVEGNSKTYTIKAAPNYAILDVLIDGVSKGVITNYTFDNVTGDHTIQASFAPSTNSITASFGVGGIISPAGTTEVPYGGSQTYTIQPHSGFDIADVYIDGVSVGRTSSYTFSNISRPHTISASFQANGSVTLGDMSFTDSFGADLSGTAIKAGYGFSANVVGVSSGVTDAKMTLTYNFGGGNKTVVLAPMSGGVYQFPVNPDSLIGQRCVYIPVTTRDGIYAMTLTYMATRYDGTEISTTKTATVTVHGTMYEDDLTGDS